MDTESEISGAVKYALSYYMGKIAANSDTLEYVSRVLALIKNADLAISTSHNIAQDIYMVICWKDWYTVATGTDTDMYMQFYLLGMLDSMDKNNPDTIKNMFRSLTLESKRCNDNTKEHQENGDAL